MTSRDRVLDAINLKKPDIIPADMGSTNCTSISKFSYDKLKKKLGILNKSDRFLMEKFNINRVDEEVLQILNIDTRGIIGKLEAYPKTIINEKTFYDHFGVKYFMPENGLYYDIVENPLAKMKSLEEIKEYQWPNPINKKFVEGLKNEAKRLHQENQYAIVGDVNDSGIFEPSWYLRGFENFLYDLSMNPEISLYIMEKMLEFQKKRYAYFLSEVGEYLDIVFVGDDLATSNSTLISPKMYRSMIKPLQKDYFTFLKKHTKAKLMYHSCGNIGPFLNDLIEIGIDILNPIQVNAMGMDIDWLKKEFGEKLCFWGGIDTSKILPSGTVKEVIQEVKRVVKILGPNGYVGCAVHDIQADVPAENIIAMFQTFKSIRI